MSQQNSDIKLAGSSGQPKSDVKSGTFFLPKFLVILLFTAVLGFAVYKMMQFEGLVREARVIRVGSVTEKPLLPDIDQDTLMKYASLSDLNFLAGSKYFSIKKSVIRDGKPVTEWNEHFLKGVNLGVALPGKYPTEFSVTFEQYHDWFRQISAMNANSVRVYTILPPDFYEALAQFNIENSNKPVFLLQGVWAVDCEGGNYLDPDYSTRFKKEIKTVIDVIHGNAVIEEKPGHASGIYARDVSKYVSGIVLGREWEPSTVVSTNAANKGLTKFLGDFVSMPSGEPMEVWLAEMMEFTVKAETQLYKMQRPVSFVNWLPLDPMFHNTEFIENRKVREYDNDIVSIDFRKFAQTKNFKAGIFASYHAYPYYPDYVYLSEKYRNGVNHNDQRDSYYAYLEDLRNHCPDKPLIIAEYGLPSSRGNSHSTPFGFNQGGLSENEQAEHCKVLTQDIFNTGCGGAIYFEWIDEWFKFNWLVMDFEIPAERTKLWHNMENPEQNFGVLAVESRSKVIDGEDGDWSLKEKISDGKFAEVFAAADASYFYLKLKSKTDYLKSRKIFLAIDTYDRAKGSHKLPHISENMKHGYEFLVIANGQDSSVILVDEPYSVYSDIYNDFIPGYASVENYEGRFVRQIMLSNRERESLTGESFGRKIYDRSSLIHGNSSHSETSNSNIFINEDEGVIEFRLPWHLLNVTDPSSLMVLADKKGTPEIEAVKTDFFNITTYFVSEDRSHTEVNESEGDAIFRWRGWEEPEYVIRQKKLYEVLREEYSHLKVKKDISTTDSVEGFSIAEWYNDAPLAVSVSLDDGTISQYNYGLPVLDKYNVKVTFAIISEWTKDNPSFSAERGGISVEKLGWAQIRQLVRDGHEIASHGFLHVKMDTMHADMAQRFFTDSRNSIESGSGSKVLTFVFPYSSVRDDLFRLAQSSGYLFARAGEETPYVEGELLNVHRLSTIPIYNESTPSGSELFEKLTTAAGEWKIINYHNIFPGESKEMGILRSHDVYSTYSVTPEMFDRQIRLIRNTGAWVAPIREAGRYVMQREKARIVVSRLEDNTAVKIELNSDGYDFYVPMTILMKTSADLVSVAGTIADGTYQPVNGIVRINAFPNKNFYVKTERKYRP